MERLDKRQYPRKETKIRNLNLCKEEIGLKNSQIEFLRAQKFKRKMKTFLILHHNWLNLNIKTHFSSFQN